MIKFAAIFLFVFSTSVFAQPYTEVVVLKSVQDTYIDSNNPTTSFGGQQYMKAHFYSGSVQSVALFRFNLGLLKNPPTSATVKLTKDTGDNTTQYKLCTTNNQWAENTVKWNYYSSINLTTPVHSSVSISGNEMSIPLAESYISGDYALVPKATSYMSFKSTASGSEPRLELTYSTTVFGDSNFDGQFNSTDLVHIFQQGKYETGAAATWTSGDWNADGFFTSADFVLAFTIGNYDGNLAATWASISGQ